MAATNAVTVGCIKKRPTHEDLSHRMTGYVDPTKEAFAAYGRESFPAFSRFGGHIVWRGRFELMLIGPRDATWDACFVAEYISVAAFVEMLRDPVYREAAKHRQAAVLDSRRVRLMPSEAGIGFLAQ